MLRVSWRGFFPRICYALALLGGGCAHEGERASWRAERFVLANGLQVVVLPDPLSPVVTHMIWHKVGAADESPGKTGLAHFLEHLMFKDRRQAAQGGFSGIVARAGGRDNAFTSLDYTAYYQRIGREKLDLVMGLEAARLRGLELSAAAVAAEREVVLEERALRQGRDPGWALHQKMRAALFGAHPYAREIIGLEADIAALSLADALEFHRRYYAPQAAVVILAGGVEAAQARALAEKHYGGIARRGAGRGAQLAQVERRRGGTARIIHKADAARAAAFYRTYVLPNAVRAGADEAAALEVLAEILGGGPRSRLYRDLVLEEKAAVSAWASLSLVQRGPGRLFISASPPADSADLAPVEAGLERSLRRVLEEGIQAGELERARTRLMAEAVYARDDQRQMANIFGRGLAAGLSVGEIVSWEKRIAAVDREMVEAAARKYLRPERAVSGWLLPGGGG